MHSALHEMAKKFSPYAINFDRASLGAPRRVHGTRHTRRELDEWHSLVPYPTPSGGRVIRALVL